MLRLFHISDDPHITLFAPRPSPSHYDMITGDVVFAVSGELLHNYLLPRNCPRVSFYPGPNTTLEDVRYFMGDTTARYVLAIEKNWVPAVQAAAIYCYELPVDDFILLDECAGYYISYRAIPPIAVTRIDNLLDELLIRDVELRIVESLWPLADAVKASTMNYSCIRMKFAEPR
jgi:hypothetical protein